MFKNILLGVDGSEHALRAARTAGDLARAVQAETLRIVAAFDPIPSYLGEPHLEAAISARMEAADQTLKNAQQAVGNIAGKIHLEVLEGPPAEAILKVAATHHNDLIVMGSRGLGRLTGALLGSQSQKVVQHATCPVLIVR
ncbi:MAG: universal stress protein [Anaerolineales bacterium]